MSFIESLILAFSCAAVGWLLREETIVGKFCKNPTKVVAWLEAKMRERNTAID